MAIWRAQAKINDPNIGGTGVNLWHFRTDAEAFEEASAQQSMDWVKAFYTAIASLLVSPATVTWDGSAQEIATDSPRALEGLTGFTVAASGAGAGLPPANCICVGWRTELSARSGRGRTFLGTIKASAVEANGTVATASLSTVRTAASALVTSSMSESVPVGALGVWSPTDQIFRDFTGSAVRDQFAVLRSRRD